MAVFSNHISTVLANEGGYSGAASDPGNYLNGQLIGTNRGITPAAYQSYFGKTPTVADMKALTEQQAAAIYKRDYWDKMGGDAFPENRITTAVFDFYINSPKGAGIVLQSLLNGAGLSVDVDGVIGPQTRQALNHLYQARADIYNDFNAGRKEYYRWRAGQQTAENWAKVFQAEGVSRSAGTANLQGLLNRVNDSFPTVQLQTGSIGTRDLAAANERAQLAKYQRIGIQAALVVLGAMVLAFGFRYLVKRVSAKPATA